MTPSGLFDPFTAKPKDRRSIVKAVCDLGSTRVVGEVIKENPLTTLVKIDPKSLIKVLRSYFMENGISLTEYYSHIKSLGLKRNGVTKRHNLKHNVRLCQ
jgi:hypothetical protein